MGVIRKCWILYTLESVVCCWLSATKCNKGEYVFINAIKFNGYGHGKLVINIVYRSFHSFHFISYFFFFSHFSFVFEMSYARNGNLLKKQWNFILRLLKMLSIFFMFFQFIILTLNYFFFSVFDACKQ